MTQQTPLYSDAGAFAVIEPMYKSYFVGIFVLRGFCVKDGQTITRTEKRAYRRNNKPKTGCYAGMQSNGKQEQAKTDQRTNLN